MAILAGAARAEEWETEDCQVCKHVERRTYTQAKLSERDGDCATTLAKYQELGDFLDSAERYAQLLPHAANQVRPFQDGAAAFEVGGKWGLIDAEGHVTLAPTWDEIGIFREGRAVALRQDAAGRKFYDIIDTRGRVIWESDSPVAAYSDWSDIAYCRYAKSGLTPICQNGKWGYVNLAGETVISGWDRANGFSENGVSVVGRYAPDEKGRLSTGNM